LGFVLPPPVVSERRPLRCVTVKPAVRLHDGRSLLNVPLVVSRDKVQCIGEGLHGAANAFWRILRGTLAPLPLLNESVDKHVRQPVKLVT
jgi:hypothetical protein